MSDYICMRCGGSNCYVPSEPPDDGGEGADSDDGQLLGWCEDCADYRYLEE